MDRRTSSHPFPFPSMRFANARRCGSPACPGSLSCHKPTGVTPDRQGGQHRSYFHPICRRVLPVTNVPLCVGVGCPVDTIWPKARLACYFSVERGTATLDLPIWYARASPRLTRPIGLPCWVNSPHPLPPLFTPANTPQHLSIGPSDCYQPHARTYRPLSFRSL